MLFRLGIEFILIMIIQELLALCQGASAALDMLGHVKSESTSPLVYLLLPAVPAWWNNF